MSDQTKPDEIDTLMSLHTALVDARNGYEEALEDAEGKGLTPLFREMMALHGENADSLAMELRLAGQSASDEGSFMSTVHRAVISVRSLFGGLDESILPGLIDGEERLLKYYDEALAVSGQGGPINAKLNSQRAVLEKKIGEMKARKEIAA